VRIAFAIHDVRRGGGQDRYALELVNRLAGRHEITVFACSAEHLDPRISFIQIETPMRPAALRNRVFTREVRQRLRKRDWDIVHAAGGAVPGATVITAHFCHTASRKASKRWPSAYSGFLERAYRSIDTTIAIRNERHTARHPQLRALIAVSNRTLDEWRSGYELSAPVQAVIPNGVDASDFRPGENADRLALKSELDIPPTARVLLLVGALVRKGVETALEVSASLGPHSYLVAVGAGPHDRVTAMANRLGVQEQLRLVAPVPDVERYYRGADVLLFPTRYEPFGMVIAEAWASGLPVVSAATAGALEWAAAGDDVMVVDDPGNAGEFARATSAILENQELATRLLIRGRALAETLTWDRVAAETEAVYQQAVGS